MLGLDAGEHLPLDFLLLNLFVPLTQKIHHLLVLVFSGYFDLLYFLDRLVDLLLHAPVEPQLILGLLFRERGLQRLWLFDHGFDFIFEGTFRWRQVTCVAFRGFRFIIILVDIGRAGSAGTGSLTGLEFFLLFAGLLTKLAYQDKRLSHFCNFGC